MTLPKFIEIEGLLFPGFGPMRALHRKLKSEVTRVLKMELFQLKKFEHAWLMMSLDGKNLRAGVCPNPGNSKPSISIMLTLPYSRYYFSPTVKSAVLVIKLIKKLIKCCPVDNVIAFSSDDLNYKSSVFMKKIVGDKINNQRP